MILTTIAIKQLYNFFLNHSYVLHITPLIINSLAGGYTHAYRGLHRNNFKKPGVHWPVADVHMV